MPQLDLGKVVGDTGPQGPKGDQGIQGPAGPAGPGVAVGGSANQVLVKHSGTNYDTQWVDDGSLPAFAGVRDAIAIIANGDTHPAIASGQFVYVQNHSTLAEGLYKATAAIGTNVALTTSNLTADSQGGLNALKADVDSLNSKLTSARQTCTINSTYLKEGEIIAFTIGNLAFIQIADMKFKSALPSSSESNAIVLATLPFNVSPSRVIFAVMKLSDVYSIIRLRIQNNAIYPWWSDITETTGEGYIGNVVINLGT